MGSVNYLTNETSVLSAQLGLVDKEEAFKDYTENKATEKVVGSAVSNIVLHPLDTTANLYKWLIRKSFEANTSKDPVVQLDQQALLTEFALSLGLEASANKLATFTPPKLSPSLLTPEETIIWQTENASKSALANNWEASASGSRSDLATRKRLVPSLPYNNPNPKGRPFVRFDAIDPNNPYIIVDRKVGATTFSKQIADIQRVADSLSQHPQYQLRIEVPHQKAYSQVNRLIDKAFRRNKPSQIIITIVPP